MRITKSDGYEEDPCDESCEKAYCRTHRLLWRYCETAKGGMDDTYTNGKAHMVYEWGDCPQCEHESKMRRAIRYWEGHHAKSA